MARFDPKLLVPAMLADADTSKRTAKSLALASINRMKEQFAAGDGAEGKLNFKTMDGNRIGFTIRVSNTPMVLERTKVEDTEVEVREMSIPKANFVDALDYYADRITSGEYDAQLAEFDAKKALRTEKVKATRASKKAEPAKE